MFWMWLIVGIVLLALVFGGLMRLLARPIPYRGLLLTDTERFLKGFLLQLGPGSVLMLERESGPGFLQLAIRERHGDLWQIEFGLPDADWSRERFDLVRDAMVNAGIANDVETNRDNKDIPRFLRVYIEGNRDDLILVLLRILELAANQLEFKKDDQYTLRMSGDISSEYQNELATQLEKLPQRNVILRPLASWLRRSASRNRQL